MSGEKKIKAVKAYRITNSILINGNGESTRDLAYFYEFDDDGNRIAEISYEEGNPEHEVKRTFENGNLVCEQITFVTDGVSEVVNNTYDDGGLIVSSVRTYSDGSNEKTEYHYQDGRLIRKVLLDDDGEIESEDNFSYENGKLKEHSVTEYGLLKSKIVRSYNEKGQEIEEIRIDEEGNALKVYFEPKDDKRLPDIKICNSDGKVVEAVVHRYDETGRLMQEIVESSMKGFKRLDTRYTYDERGFLVKEETLDKDGLMRKRILREYDEEGVLQSEQVHEENPEYGTLVNLTTEFEYEFFT